MKILIVEDIMSDIKYYQPLESIMGNISFLFLAPDLSWTPIKTREHIELLYDKTFSWIEKYYAYTIQKIGEFLKNNRFDFYIFDGLDKRGVQMVREADLSKEKIAFLSSSGSSRRSAQEEGYRAYRKEDISKLIQDC